MEKGKTKTMKYEPVMGLEVHVELNTKTKMFCRCSVDYFGEKPNTHTCPVCLGLPGALPYINEKAIEGCMKIGLSLNCSVAEVSRFERKNYFYPDLPKGYQISQYRWPLCVGGWIEVENAVGEKIKIRINRAHQEEDTAKLTHAAGQTLIDFNRSGVPLVEIVSEPDFTDTAQVRDYAKKLQQLFRYLGVSGADMERGDMRLEANISVRPVGQKELPNYRVELKNINSFRFMVAAIEYEIKRQIEALEKGETLTQETRGWNEDKKETYLQRSKEEAHDYRYFPEPDLPEIRVDRLQAFGSEAQARRVTVDSIKEKMPELPWEKEARFVSEYGISEASARILAETIELAGYFEEAVKLGKEMDVEPKQVANCIINQKVDIEKTLPAQLVELILGRGAGVIGDIGELEKIAEEVILENPGIVELYKKGKVTVIQALVGAAMRKTGGKVNAEKIREILESKLGS